MNLVGTDLISKREGSLENYLADDKTTGMNAVHGLTRYGNFEKSRRLIAGSTSLQPAAKELEAHGTSLSGGGIWIVYGTTTP